MRPLIKIYFIPVLFGLFVLVSPVHAVASPVATRSNEVKVKACLAREQVIKTRMNSLVKTTENMERVFDNIAKRVEEYYQQKVTAGGGVVSNYDALVQAIGDSKVAVQTSLDKAASDSAGFSCGASGNPKLALLTFRKDMQDVKTKLKEMRTAVKNLIVAVHTVNKDSLESPKPTKVKLK